jgi:hypothetical protein
MKPDQRSCETHSRMKSWGIVLTPILLRNNRVQWGAEVASIAHHARDIWDLGREGWTWRPVDDTASIPTYKAMKM